ncbi:MAG: gfo/Idh/MocA family oxidoreductase, partial [Anaerolineaceae bacterium]|nr:gfo/Idh/MocA family oxidoreductase [Anaerolineaceae bacterium]
MSNVRAAVVGLGFTGRTHIASLRRLGIDVCGVMGVNEQESR